MATFNKALLKGSLVLLITFNIFNLINFVFQSSMARLLNITDYAVLATLFSVIYFLGIFSESIQTIITKYSASENNKGKLKEILNKSLKKGFKISAILFIVYIIIAIPAAALLKISYKLIALNGLIIFSSFLVPINRGILQGTKRFNSLGFNLIIEAVVKLILSIALVLIGWKVYGPITATVIGSAIAFIFALCALKDIRKAREEKAKTLDIRAYTRPVFVIIFSVIVLYSLDIIIAKIVFPVELAGSYAIASILSKTIFWGTQPISKAMFPLSADKTKKKTDRNVYTNALIILFALIIIALLIMWLMPSLIIKIFSGKILPESSSILFFLGIAMSMLSIANLNLLHKLSLGNTNGYKYFFLFVLIEILLLFFFSHNLFEYSIALVTTSALFLFGSVILLNK